MYTHIFISHLNKYKKTYDNTYNNNKNNCGYTDGLCCR